MADGSWAHPFPPNHHLHFSPLKRVQLRQDSEGRSYSIFVQNEELSCALAAATMLIGLYKHKHFPNASAEEHRLKGQAAKFPGSLADDDKLWPARRMFGSSAANVKSLLQSQGVVVTKEEDSPAGIDTKHLARPGIVLWGWYDAHGRRNGGHFTVAARVTKAGRVVILDPWDGNLTELMPNEAYKKNGKVDVVLYTN